MTRRVLLAVMLGTAVLAAAGLWIRRDMQTYMTTPMNIDSPRILTVRPGTSLTSLARQLEAKGWLERPYYLVMEGRLRDSARRIKAGEFAIPAATTPAGLLEILVSGRVVQYALTLVEGWTFAQMMQAVNANTALVHTLSGASPTRVMGLIGYPGYFPEGRFYPDTYHFPAGTTDVQFLRRAYDSLAAVLDEEWRARDEGLPYESPYQALILASLVEKETAVAEERPKIAGVFARRLQKGMKLQTDPTVIYALGDAFDGDLRRADLDIDSPFNTYVYTGLPPTPIALVGRASIRAALHPEPGADLYFVARGDGSHEFSTTLKAHNNAVRRYQLNGRPAVPGH